MSDSLPPGTRSNFPHAVVMTDALRRQQVAAVIASMSEIEIHRSSALLDTPSILLQAVIIPGDKTAEGTLIESVALPWFEIINLLAHSPEAIYAIHWRKWEEIIAGAYTREGYEVVLTSRSNDKGRDVLATKRGVGSQTRRRFCMFLRSGQGI